MPSSTAMNLLPLLLLIFIMYFLLIRPQKKREKATNEMRNSLKAGDEIITIGGICGKIVKVKDESLIIQVGAEKIKFEVMRWSISKVVSGDAAVSPRKEKASSGDSASETPKKVVPKKLKREKTEAPAAEAAEENAPAEGEPSLETETAKSEDQA